MNNKFRYTLALVAKSVIVIHLTILVDYSDLSWDNNSGSYLGITSMLLLIFAMFSEIKRVNNQELPSEK